MKGGNAGRLTQVEAAQILGMCERSFRRYLVRYEADGLDGLIDRRLEQISNHRAPVDEVMALSDQYRSRHTGWNVKHFHSWYRRDGGTRSYSWVKNHLQKAHLVPKAEKRGTHRKRREDVIDEMCLRRGALSGGCHGAWPGRVLEVIGCEYIQYRIAFRGKLDENTVPHGDCPCHPLVPLIPRRR